MKKLLYQPTHLDHSNIAICWKSTDSLVEVLAVKYSVFQTWEILPIPGKGFISHFLSLKRRWIVPSSSCSLLITFSLIYRK